MALIDPFAGVQDRTPFEVNMAALHDQTSRTALRRHHRRLKRSALVGCVLASMLVACRADELGPTPPELDATYALVTVDGRRVPEKVAEGSGHLTTLIADTLRFSRNGTVVRSVAYHSIGDPSVLPFIPEDTTYRFQITYPYVVKGNWLRMGNLNPCPPNANCLGSESGTITASGIILRGGLFWGAETEYRYGRMREP